jgi:Flavin containing amine oxidoreductase
VNDTIWFAGEAAHETLWGTVGGAWESGERAADAVLRRLGVLKTPAPGEVEAAPTAKAKRTRAVPREQSSFGGTPSIMRPER